MGLVLNCSRSCAEQKSDGNGPLVECVWSQYDPSLMRYARQAHAPVRSPSHTYGAPALWRALLAGRSLAASWSPALALSPTRPARPLARAETVGTTVVVVCVATALQTRTAPPRVSVLRRTLHARRPAPAKTLCAARSAVRSAACARERRRPASSAGAHAHRLARACGAPRATAARPTAAPAPTNRTVRTAFCSFEWSIRRSPRQARSPT